MAFVVPFTVLMLVPCAADDPKPQDTHWVSEVRFHDGAGLLGFSADGKHLAAGGGGEIRVLAVPGGKEVVRMQLPNRDYLFGAFAADGKHLVSVGGVDKTVRFWSLATGKQTRELDLPRAKEVQWIVGFSPGAKVLAVRLTESVVLVNPDTGKVIAEFAGAGPTETSFKTAGGAFSPDGKRFAAGAGEGRLGVWDVETGKQLAVSAKKERAVSGDFVYMQFSPDGRWVAVGNGGIINQPTQIWDATTAELLAEPVKANGYSGPIAWTPDGTAVVTCDHNGVVATDVATGRTVHKFERSPYSGGGVYYPSPSGKHLVFVDSSTRPDPNAEQPKSNSAYLVQLPAAKKPAPPKAELAAAELDAFWADIATPNKIRREQIRTALAAAPGSAVAYLVRKTPATTAADVARVRELVAQLDDDAPDARKRAQEQLAGVAHRFERPLRLALADAKPGEIKNRLTFLIGEVDAKPLPPDLLAELKAVEHLARLNTPDAVKHLTAVAGGADSRVTAEAKAALEKPDRRP